MDKFPNGAKIVFIKGKRGGRAAIDRAKGVHDTIKAAGEKYKIVAEQTANWARSESLTVTQNVLTSLGYTPDAIIAANDDRPLGALEALHQMGIPTGNILVFGLYELP